jgi:hypothetical protein
MDRQILAAVWLLGVNRKAASRTRHRAAGWWLSFLRSGRSRWST